MNSIYSEKAAEPVGKFPHSKRVGNFLFLSGIGPRVKGSKDIPGVTLNEKGEIISYDIKTQCHAVFQNVKFILEESGTSWDKLIDVTVFLTNMKDDFPAFNKIWADYFKDNPPCRTTIEINCLPTPIAIELKCIAYIDN
jgi:2-aminomuconate deaminase